MSGPSKWSVSPPSLRLPPPRLGQHSQAILAELGYNRGEIQQMIAGGITKIEA